MTMQDVTKADIVLATFEQGWWVVLLMKKGKNRGDYYLSLVIYIDLRSPKILMISTHYITNLHPVRAMTAKIRAEGASRKTNALFGVDVGDIPEVVVVGFPVLGINIVLVG